MTPTAHPNEVRACRCTHSRDRHIRNPESMTGLPTYWTACLADECDCQAFEVTA